MPQTVTLLIVDREMNNIHEINTFIDINSKGKKVSTDLAIRLRDQMRKDEGYYRTFDDLVESIATRVAIQLSEEEFTSVWYKAIKIGPEIKGRIISINAFSKSITPIIKIFVDLNKYDFKEINEDEVAQLVEEISGIINGIWNIISDRWSECFIKDIIKFNKKYNIQKGVGVYSLHTLFSQCLKENDKDVMDAIHKFRDIIYNSKVQDYDWIVGGRFSGLSSSGGFDQIINSVKSEIN